MADKETVIMALHQCSDKYELFFDDKCEQCPYRKVGPKCIMCLMQDALQLLEDDEEREA